MRKSCAAPSGGRPSTAGPPLGPTARRLGTPVSDRHAARRAAGDVSLFAPMGRRDRDVPSLPVGSEGESHAAGRRHDVRGAEHRACRSETGVPSRRRPERRSVSASRPEPLDDVVPGSDLRPPRLCGLQPRNPSRCAYWFPCFGVAPGPRPRHDGSLREGDVPESGCLSLENHTTVMPWRRSVTELSRPLGGILADNGPRYRLLEAPTVRGAWGHTVNGARFLDGRRI